MIDYVGSTKTNGARALDFTRALLIGGSTTPAESSAMVLGIIDAKSGRILWTNMSTAFKDLFSSGADKLSNADKVDIKKVNALIENALSKLHNR
jgi:hypothetical protein